MSHPEHAVTPGGKCHTPRLQLQGVAVESGYSIEGEFSATISESGAALGWLTPCPRCAHSGLRLKATDEVCTQATPSAPIHHLFPGPGHPEPA